MLNSNEGGYKRIKKVQNGIVTVLTEVNDGGMIAVDF